jgi:hypothetical protein
MSKKHFWPAWASALIGSDGVNRIEAKYTVNFPSFRPQNVSTQERPGPTKTKKLRVVCKNCNNEWMSGIEERAKPILTPLILGTQATLNYAEQTVVAAWIALKVIIGDHSVPVDSAISQEARTSFHRDQSPLRGLRVRPETS